jgi:hypothetical protein
MSLALLKDSTLDRDKWLENQIRQLTSELLKQPANNRGPFVISDDMLSGKKSRQVILPKLKMIK